MPKQSIDIHQLYSRILGHPQQNVDKAISNFVHEFETKRPSQDEHTKVILKDAPAQLENAKVALESDLENVVANASTTLERLQLLQKSISDNSQKHQKTVTATQLAKETFQRDISEAKEAFDQEMALRHADVVKQYVGTFVQQIDHY